MKYSMMTYSVARQRAKGEAVDMQAICDLTVDLGLDAIDIGLYGDDAQDVRRIAEDRGLKIICYTTSADFVHPPGPARQAAMDEFYGIIDTATLLGTNMVMIPMAPKPGGDRAQVRRFAIECLVEAVDFARKAGITVTTEPFVVPQAPFIVSDDFKEALQEVPDLRITFDSGNPITGGEDPVDAFVQLKDKVVFTHFKDWVIVDEGGMTGLNGKHYQPVLIGEGIIDYPLLMQTMKDSGYDGYINLEYEGDKYPAPVALRKALKYLRSVESSLD